VAAPELAALDPRGRARVPGGIVEPPLPISRKPEFPAKCRRCGIVNLCLWCLAHAALEDGEMDEWIEYFSRRATT